LDAYEVDVTETNQHGTGATMLPPCELLGSRPAISAELHGKTNVLLPNAVLGHKDGCFKSTSQFSEGRAVHFYALIPYL
jgi:hypothetical protein